jgi:hypothetical protein
LVVPIAHARARMRQAALPVTKRLDEFAATASFIPAATPPSSVAGSPTLARLASLAARAGSGCPCEGSKKVFEADRRRPRSSTQSGADLSQRIDERLDVGAVVVAVERDPDSATAGADDHAMVVG